MKTIEYRGYTIQVSESGYTCDYVTTAFDLASMKKYIDGWIADEMNEAKCDSLASKRME